MFRRKPIELAARPTAVDVPEGPQVQAAREKLASTRAAITEAADQLTALGDELREAERRLGDAGTKKANAESLIRRAAVGETVPKPSAAQFAGLIEQHARAEHEAAGVRQRVEKETERVSKRIEKLREQTAADERGIDQARFIELVQAYRQAITPAIPIARALREAAAKVGKGCNDEPMLLDTDSDHAGALFGAKL